MKKFNYDNKFEVDGEIPFDSFCNLEIMLDKEDPNNIWYRYSDDNYVYSAEILLDFYGIRYFRKINLDEIGTYRIMDFESPKTIDRKDNKI